MGAAQSFELPMPIIVAAVSFVCLGLAVWVQHHALRIRGREAAVRSAAEQLDLRYHGEDVRSMGRVRFAVYDGADFVNVSHQVSGRTPGGTVICAYDFSGAREVVDDESSGGLTTTPFGVDGAPSTTTRRVSAGTFATAAVADVGAYFPSLMVSPQGALRRLVNNVTGADIKFESTDFNRLFQVTSENEGFARLFLSPTVIDMLTSAEGSIGLETFGRSVVLFGEDVQGAQLPGLARLAGRLVESLDPVVLREYPPPDLVVPGEFRRPFLS